MNALATAPAQHATVVWHHASRRLRTGGGRVRQAVRVDLIGCGGNGARMLLHLVTLGRALTALGHPGLQVRVYDGDRVTEANLARQPFARADIGHYKCVCLVHRVNLSYGTSHEAVPRHFSRKTARSGIAPVITIGCVDTRRARAAIAEAFTGWGESGDARYWLDLGNNRRTGQVLLGTAGQCEVPLPTCADRWPEIVDPALDDDAAAPACSSREALRRQDLFVNEVLCAQAANLLGRLFRDGRIRHHGAFCNLETGHVRPIPVPAPE